MPQRIKGTRESNADRAAGPSALRLDQLPAEVLQACAVHLAQNCWIEPQALTEAFLLPTVCRRLKEALERPYWSVLGGALAARLWRALGRPGAPLPVLHGVEKLHPATGAQSTAWESTHEEDSARRWLKVQGGAVKCVRGLAVGVDAGYVPGRNLDAVRLSTLLASLPALTSIGSPGEPVSLCADAHRTPTAAAVRAFLAGAARAIGRCSGLQSLHLGITLLGGLADQLPEALVRALASVRTLEEVNLTFETFEDSRPDWPVTFSLAHLVAGLAGLPRLRALILTVQNVCMDATLPASVSRLAQLTYLRLSDIHGLRCEPGWARLPALARLQFVDCEFAGDGEAALPGMDALAALTSLELDRCPSLRLLPASLWRLSQLRCLSHDAQTWDEAGEPRSAVSVLGLPLSAPCFASLTELTLTGHNLRMPLGGAPCFASLTRLTLAARNLRAFPLCILAATRLQFLDLADCCFGQLPEGVSALTGLEQLHLGWPSLVEKEVGGSIDARALGSLAAFPRLRRLSFENCSVQFCSDFQAAAAHPRLEQLRLTTARVRGAGRRSSCDFRAALDAAGFPFEYDAYSSAEEASDF